MVLWQSHLLENVAKIKRHMGTQSKYNIFEVLEIADKEVVMCRFLYDLLDVNGYHGNGIFYLKKFMKKILRMDSLTDAEIETYQVYKEYVIGENRRIDLVLFNGSHFIPIEVKIDAGEQPHQCYDYFQYAVSHNEDPSSAELVYLTKYGDFPSEYSTRGTMEKEVVPVKRIRCISFCDDIRKWLTECAEEDNTATKVLLEQYIDVLAAMRRNEFEEMKEMVSKEILKDSTALRASLMISDSINQAKAALMRTVFQDLDAALQPRLEKYHLEKEIRAGWYTYEQQATEAFYQHNYSTYPGLNYVVKDAVLSGDKALWLRIEVDNNLFAGFCAFDYSLKSEEGSGNQIDTMEAAALMEYQSNFLVPVEPDAWWLKWVYLPTGTKEKYKMDQVPDFKAMNDAAVNLADVGKRKEFIDKAISVIEQNLLSLLKTVKSDCSETAAKIVAKI